jgi:hypothetical protein
MTKKRIAVTGGPRTGKTTFSDGLPGVRHTDDFADQGWGEQADAASLFFDDPDASVVEGVMVPRALRKWLDRNPEGKPVDEVMFLKGAHGELTPGQQSMTKGVETVLRQITPELKRRGVKVRGLK